MTRQDPTLDDTAIPRCCRTQYIADLANGLTPEDLRPLDPSGRYVSCTDCIPGTRNTPDLGPAEPYVPSTWGLRTTDVPPALINPLRR